MGCERQSEIIAQKLKDRLIERVGARSQKPEEKMRNFWILTPDSWLLWSIDWLF
jgi:hypothetical protein